MDINDINSGNDNDSDNDNDTDTDNDNELQRQNPSSGKHPEERNTMHARRTC